MKIFLTTLLIGISLSMDAFSLALVYGMRGILQKNEMLLSFCVGIFHFFMPLIGCFFGNVIYSYYEFNVNLFVGIIFGVIGIEMIVSSILDKDVNVLSNFLSYFIFSLSVSIDSFTTGIGLNAINSNYLEVSVVFMLCSGLFTYLGLKLGNILNIRFGKYSTIFGGVTLIILGILYMFKK